MQYLFSHSFQIINLYPFVKRKLKASYIVLCTFVYTMELSSNSCVLVLVTLILSIVSATTPSMVGVTEEQLNCTSNRDICKDVCRESTPLSYSATFCDAITGSCVCDCRDTIRSDCEQEPFTTCFQQCVKKNPNPDVFLYEGGNCPVTDAAGRTKYQCACECSFRDDYVETNDVN